ncbi:hypothetical protein [Pedobacter steynii]
MDVPDGNVSFNRVDDGKAPLAGVWRITGRMQEDGKVADIHQTGSRQTYKMLTGKKFQWVAIDPEKRNSQVPEVVPILLKMGNIQSK